MDIGTIYILIAVVLLIISSIKNVTKTKQALLISLKIALNIFPVLLFIFVLMGLLQVMVPKELIAGWLGGKGTGFLTVVYGEIVGCFALIQPAAVFPFAGYLHQNGANYGSILGFVMTAILIGISTIVLEIKLFGKKFTLIRNLLTLVLVFIIGLFFNFIF